MAVKRKNPASKCRICGGAYRIRTGDLYNANGISGMIYYHIVPLRAWFWNFPSLYAPKMEFSPYRNYSVRENPILKVFEVRLAVL